MTQQTAVEEHALVAGLRREQLLELYYYMQLARSAEEVLDTLAKQGHMHGGVYRSLGQEGAAAGTAYALRARKDGTGDFISYVIRDTAAIFAHGGRPLDYFRHCLARETGLSRGRESGTHFSDFARGLLGPISHLGTMVGLMAGITWSFQLRDEDRVGMVYIGDGGSSTGAFHEGLNFAAVQRCPMILVIEANKYAFSTPTSKQTRAEHLVDKASGYGIPGERVDGNDVIACYEAAKRARDRASRGEGASLLEVDTFRRLGHAQHDAQDYVTREEIGLWEERDPIARFGARLLGEGWATQNELDEITERTLAEARAEADQTLSEALPAGETAPDSVYSNMQVPKPWTRLDPPDLHAS